MTLPTEMTAGDLRMATDYGKSVGIPLTKDVDVVEDAISV
jgi:hypothetical protein